VGSSPLTDNGAMGCPCSRGDDDIGIGDPLAVVPSTRYVRRFISKQKTTLFSGTHALGLGVPDVLCLSRTAGDR
jgi:hypothetical protein